MMCLERMLHRTKLVLVLGVVVGVAGCAATNSRVVTKLNEDATLGGGLPSNPLQGKVITSWIDKTDQQHAVMATMFGNEIAAGYARSNAGHAYPAGSVLSVVTWNQQEDPRWFGGNIPASTRSVEFVRVGETADHQASYAYEKFEGSPLKSNGAEQAATPNQRASYLLSQRAAVMP
jgi:hypothetical protein